MRFVPVVDKHGTHELPDMFYEGVMFGISHGNSHNVEVHILLGDGIIFMCVNFGIQPLQYLYKLFSGHSLAHTVNTHYCHFCFSILAISQI